MANRNTFNGSSTDVPWPNVGMPEGFGDQYARHIKTLYDVAAFPLTDIGGTADDVTATLDPDLDSGGLVDGMKFTLTWASNNTGPMTLALNGGAAVDVLQADGSAMIAGAAKAGTRVLVEYIGGDFRIIGGGSGAGSVEPYYTAITASGTWTKPAGFPDDAIVEIEGWGGGGGGGGSTSGSGGGGGGYSRIALRYVDVPSSIAVVIGGGGAGANGNAADGGNTTVGSLLTAYGGIGGSAVGGGGGGELAKGTGGAGGPIGGGDSNTNAGTLWGGGGGGTGTSSSGSPAGSGVFGGGGGGGRFSSGSSPGGQSLHGGDGGAGKSGGAGNPGTAPGGGGGGTLSAVGGNGARGEVRIRIYG